MVDFLISNNLKKLKKIASKIIFGFLEDIFDYLIVINI